MNAPNAGQEKANSSDPSGKWTVTYAGVFILRLDPTLEFGQVLWIHLDEGGHGMIAEGIAGGLVGDVLLHPANHGTKIARFELVSKAIRPLAGDCRLFEVARLPQQFAKCEDFRLVQFLDLAKVAFGDLPDSRGLHAVELDFPLEESLARGSRLQCGILFEFSADLAEYSAHSYEKQSKSGRRIDPMVT